MTAFTIKMIAILTMLIDHAGAVFDLPIETRIIGRIAFPLFVYLIAEGCKHTKSMEKYMLRLGIFALISEVPFDLAFNQIPNQPLRVDFLNNTNIFYTLFLGVACVYVFRKLSGKIILSPRWILSLFSVIPFTLAADWLSTDYGFIGVLFIFCMALFDEHKPMQLAAMTMFIFWLYFPGVITVDFSASLIPFYMLMSCLLAVPIMAFANGKHGRSAKWGFYLVYPAHLLLFWALALLFT